MALALFRPTFKAARILPRISVQTASIHQRDYIGKREIVGYGFNGIPCYIDRTEFPFPSIRWKEPTAEINEIRKKEEGDWNKLTICEKKELYRASFCQTYAEFTAPTGEWQSVIGAGLILVSVAIWYYYWIKTYVYPDWPKTFSEEHRRAQFRRALDIRANPITGLASQWDYDKDDWKWK